MTDSIQLRMYRSFADITATQWRRIEAEHFPFQDYDFLRALEETQCLGDRTGWFPHIYSAWREDNLVAAIVIYEKNNSYGEYIFDWEWARAYQDHGLSYYPKWVLAAPFTPATGSKILGTDEPAKQLLLRRVMTDFDDSQASSLHALFIPPGEVEQWTRLGLQERHSLQFHWQNQRYDTFGDYLSALKGKRRRQVERERRQIPEDVTVEARSGAQLTAQDADIFYAFYESTIDKKGAIPYLTKAFFREVFATMSDRILLITASREGRPIASAINFFKGRTLFGRYWGCLEEARNLHFELCYYRAIEFAIARGLQTFEAGAQGPHKLQRGFDAAVTLSAHKIKHPAFAAAIGRYLNEERSEIAHARAEALQHSALKPVP